MRILHILALGAAAAIAVALPTRLGDDPNLDSGHSVVDEPISIFPHITDEQPVKEIMLVKKSFGDLVADFVELACGFALQVKDI
ncbi:hypothetical protein EG327_001561 [Venturia inaequalis]|uniref:Uncharacterized protein n=1 Tax=Venturia inaequalis TaxID=5025 RepID=A0A8H3ZEH5_VENIN|nr:hypothetical protein EG327_001561 [Venturia inaequalis]